MNAKKIIKLIIINLTIFTGIFGSIELASKAFTLLFLNNRLVFQKGSIFPQRSDQFNTGQIELNHAVGISHAINDFDVNPNAENSIVRNRIFTKKEYGNGSKIINIITLGGSTTDPLGYRYSSLNGTWPDQLGRIISNSEVDYKVNVINAGMDGANSSQELLRLIATFAHENKNDTNIVLSLNGINELYFLDKIYDDKDLIYIPKLLIESTRSSSIIPIAGEYYNKINSTYSGPIIKRLISSLEIFIKSKFNSETTEEIKQNYKSPIYSKAADIWESNVSIMKAVAASKGSNYTAVLQPTLGLNFDNPNYKRAMKTADIEYLNNLNRKNPKYIKDLNNLYAELRSRCKKIEYCLDLSKNIKLTTNVSFYTDHRHPNYEGNTIISNEIEKYLESKELIR